MSRRKCRRSGKKKNKDVRREGERETDIVEKALFEQLLQLRQRHYGC